MKTLEQIMAAVQFVFLFVPLLILAITTYQANKKIKSDDFALVESYRNVASKLGEYLPLALDGQIIGENNFSRSVIIGESLRVLRTLDVNRLRRSDLVTAFLDITILGAEALKFIENPDDGEMHGISPAVKSRIVNGVRKNLQIIDNYIGDYKCGKIK